MDLRGQLAQQVPQDREGLRDIQDAKDQQDQ
jgi:hypothetical protein